jgi:hypothetical protein
MGKKADIDRVPKKNEDTILRESWVWVSLFDVAEDEPHAIVDGPFGSSG